MSIKMISNFVSTRTKMPNLSDIVKAAQTQASMQKTASTEKVAEMPAFIQEKIDAKKEKEGKGDKKVDEKEEKTEKKDGKDEKKPCCASKENEEGPSSGQLAVEGKLVNDPHADPKLKGNKSTGKAKEEEAPSSGQPEAEAKLTNDPKVEGEKKDKKASAGSWVKVSNLTSKQKDFLRKTWKIFWPESYIASALADK